MLPAQFLIKHAIYMQSCAHLELAVWQIITTLKAGVNVNEVKLKDALKVKQKTGVMLKEFSKAIPFAPFYVIPALKDLSFRINTGVVNRNIAAHGAFHWDDSAGKASVAHYWQDYETKEWMHVSEPVSMRVVQDAIDEADFLLKEAVRIRHIIWEAYKVPLFSIKASGDTSAFTFR